MGIAAGLAAAGAAASLGSTISNAVGGGGSSGGQGGYYSGSSPPPAYIPQNQPGADQQYYNLVSQMGGAAGYLPNSGLLQGYSTYGGQLMSNPYAGMDQAGANIAALYGLGPSLAPYTIGPTASIYGGTPPGWLGSTASGGATGGGGIVPGALPSPNTPFLSGGQGGFTTNSVGGVAGGAAPAPNGGATGLTANAGAPMGLAPMEMGGASQLYGAGSSILNTAFDPQQELYNRTSQQVQDQANAINAMYGLSSSSAGAGVADEAMKNFNIDWQNQQLQRQAQGLTAAGRGFSGASDLGTAAMGTIQQAGALPYQTTVNALGNDISGLNTIAGSYNNVYGLDQNTLNALAAYMKLGQSATSVGQAGAAQQFGNNQTLGQALGSGLQGLSGSLSNLGGLFGSSSSNPSDLYMGNSGQAGLTDYGAYYGGGYDPNTGFGYGQGGY